MAISNGFGSFWVGNSGLTTSQNGIYVAGNNLTNVNTTGYVRQRLLQSDKIYNNLPTTASVMTGLNTKTGLGVSAAEILHTRDIFLDKYYRQENGRAEFYSTLHETTDEMETILQELEGEAFETSLGDFWESFAELAKDPSDSVNQELVAQKGSLFLAKAQSLVKSLREYQENLNARVEGEIDTINELTSGIAELNMKIMAIEGGGQETAYTLRDERDSLLDELSKHVRIEYEELLDKTVRVKIEGVVAVEQKKSFDMGLYTDDSTGYASPVWNHLTSDGSPYYIYDLSKGYSNERQSDIGSLKALLYSRGEESSNYIDALGISDSSSLVDTTGAMGKSSVIQNVEAMLDTLVHEIVTQINDIYSPITNVLYDGMVIDGVEKHNGDTVTIQGETYTVGDGNISFADSGVSLSVGDTVICDLKTYTVGITSDGNLVFKSDIGLDDLEFKVGDTVSFYLEDENHHWNPQSSVLTDASLQELPFSIWDEAKSYLGSDNEGPAKELFSRLYVDRYYEGESYSAAADTTVDSSKTYYTYNNGVYTSVTNPQDSDISSYYVKNNSGIYIYNEEDNGDDYSYIYYTPPGETTGRIYHLQSGSASVYEDVYGNTYVPVIGDGHVYCDASGNTRNTPTLYSITNMQINPLVQENATILPYHDRQGNVALDMGEALDTLWELDLEALGGQDFVEYYTEMMQDVGIWGSTFDSFEETLESTVASVDNSRQSVMAVSSDEELTNLIRYQNAYNAASRYINVIDSMTEIIVSLV